MTTVAGWLLIIVLFLPPNSDGLIEYKYNVLGPYQSQEVCSVVGGQLISNAPPETIAHHYHCEYVSSFTSG